jgi:hypothetical protein
MVYTAEVVYMSVCNIIWSLSPTMQRILGIDDNHEILRTAEQINVDTQLMYVLCLWK